MLNNNLYYSTTTVLMIKSLWLYTVVE